MRDYLLDAIRNSERERERKRESPHVAESTSPPKEKSWTELFSSRHVGVVLCRWKIYLYLPIGAFLSYLFAIPSQNFLYCV